MKIRKFKLKEFRDEKGTLVPLEFKDFVPWEVKRTYWVYDAASPRGGHAHKSEHELFICLKGSFRARLHDGKKWHEFEMKAPDGVEVPAGIWHEFRDFSKDAILLAASSTPYDRSGYIEDFDSFLKNGEDEDKNFGLLSEKAFSFWNDPEEDSWDDFLKNAPI